MNYDQQVPVVATRSNVLGMVGFWLAIGGFVTCGLTGVPALICSAMAMKQEPKGWAVAGIFVSIPSVLWCLFWVVTWTLAGIGAGSAKFDEAQTNQAKNDVVVIHPIAEKYRVDHPGTCPTVEQLRASGELAVTARTADLWGTPYAIRCGDNETYVLSFGPDRTEGTADDIAMPGR